MRIFDIGANMTHAMFRGKCRGRTKHESDVDFVFDRARAYGVRSFIITSWSLQNATWAYKLALKSNDYYATIGVHPTHCAEIFESAGLDP